MKKIMKPVLKLLFSLFLLNFLAFIPLSYAADEDEEDSDVTLTYVEWSTEIASTNVVKVVLEKMGYKTEIMPVNTIWMWQAVANGAADAHVAAWLPTTHDYYFKAVENIENLGPNLKGTRIGLVVPDYVTIDSINELNAYTNKFGKQIWGIDPGAGLMKKTEEVIKAYSLNFQLNEGSDATMTAALDEALKKKQWIVVTGWTPHWKFSRWKNLKYLDDPKGIYQPKNSHEHINTIVRESLKEELPDVYEVLDNFYWEPADIEQLMVWNTEKDADPYANAERWLKENCDKKYVKTWFKCE
jgi:glycine betaine/proline transport system substrate-binding protein